MARGEPIKAEAIVNAPRILLRSYFSTHMLWAAQHFAAVAGEIEAAHGRGAARFDIEHRSFVISSIQSAAGFLEGMINELYQDAADDHGTAGDGYIAPLAAKTRELMKQWWEATESGATVRPIAKYQMLLLFSGRSRLDAGTQPYQDAALLVRLRNALVHYRPESLAGDEPHKLQQSLSGKFPDNALMAGSGNAWWPDHCLGAGCPHWGHGAAKALADRVADDLGIEPNYRWNERKWFGRLPGTPRA